MTGHAKVEILRCARAGVRRNRRQVLAEFRIGEDGYAFIPIGGVDKDAPGKSANRTLSRTDVSIGDDHGNACVI